MALYAPEPTQDIHCKYRNARSGGNAGQRLFCAGFSVGEAVTADHDGDQTSDLRDCPSEQRLQCVKTSIERTSLGLKRPAV